MSCRGGAALTWGILIGTVFFSGTTVLAEKLSEPPFKEEVLPAPDDGFVTVDGENPVASPSGRRYAYAAARRSRAGLEGGYTVFVDSIHGPLHKGRAVGPIQFSANEEHVAYALYPNEQPAKRYGELWADGKLVSDRSFGLFHVFNDGSVAYVSLEEPGAIVVNGKVSDIKMGKFDEASLSANEKTHDVVLMWRKSDETKMFLKGETIDGHSFRFSPDEEHQAYVLTDKKAKTETAILDGRPVLSAKRVGGLVFSSDSQHLAFTCFDDEGYSIVLDGKKVASFKRYASAPSWNRGGTSFAYSGCDKDDDCAVYVNGEPRFRQWPMVVGKRGEISVPRRLSDDASHVAVDFSVAVAVGSASGGERMYADGLPVVAFFFPPESNRLVCVYRGRGPTIRQLREPVRDTIQVSGYKPLPVLENQIGGVWANKSEVVFLKKQGKLLVRVTIPLGE
jgi:hypothetical protein